MQKETSLASHEPNRIEQVRSWRTISHTSFCILYTTLVYFLYNAVNVDKITRWFRLKDDFDYSGLAAFVVMGLCIFLVVFTLFAHRWTVKPMAIGVVILSAMAAYATSKYGAVIDKSMISNSMHTDVTEVRALLTIQMIPYAVGLILLPILGIGLVRVTFERPARYLWASGRLIAVALVVTISLGYAKFDSISRATNLSRKYLIYTTIPVNYIQGFGSLARHAVAPYFEKDARKVEITGHVASHADLVVVLAIGETARRQSFGLYGYSRRDTTPDLSQVEGLHLLNGIARYGSTLYALPEILVRDEVPLPSLTSELGVRTSCHVNYTLYGACDAVGETKVANCGHGGKCYDEDVIPLLRQDLKAHDSGYRFVVLHLGGGSHGPSYHERYPPEFQRFKPMCLDADVVNQCTPEELYNAYDNSILYTDHVLGRIIEELEGAGLPYVFIYLSDHGESLLEGGHVFHGMPPGVPLPPEQANIPLIVKSSIPISIVERQEYGQQDVYDTVLGLFSIETDIRRKDRNFINKLGPGRN